MQAAPSDGKGTGRVMRKTLSRKSPFLPEVLPSMINYEDITYCTENGQLVLLGEGSFGQVRSHLLLCLMQAPWKAEHVLSKRHLLTAKPMHPRLLCGGARM